jgi:colanic acid/amylovoran biosynthesis glycosyltransferase
MKNKVLVVRFKFLFLTETFTYDEVVYLTDWRAFVYCRHRLNPLLYPFDNVYTLGRKSKHNELQVFIDDYLTPYWVKKSREQKEIRFLQNLLTTEKISLVHAHFFEEMLFCVKLKKSAAFMLIVSLHGGKDIKKMRQLDKENLAKVVLQIQSFIVKTRFMRDELIAIGVPREKVSVWRRGVDLLKWSPPDVEPNKDDTRFLFVGRCVAQKGILPLVEVFGKVLEADSSKGKKATLNIIAYTPPLFIRILEFIIFFLRYFKFKKDGFYYERLCWHIFRKKLGKYVFLQRGINPGLLKPVLARADVLVVPSSQCGGTEEYEGIPRVMLEAQAMGKAVIVSDQKSMAEGMIEGVSGYLFKEDERHGLADLLLKFITDKNKCICMGKAGRAFIEKEFNLRYNIQKLENFYETSVVQEKSQWQI